MFPKKTLFLLIVGFLSSCVASPSRGGSSSLANSEGDSSASSSDGIGDVSSSSVLSSVSGSLANSLQVIALEMSDQYGDCTLFKNGDYEILVDGGTENSYPQLEALLEKYVTDHVLELLILTHPHDDHYGGFTKGPVSAKEGGIFKAAGLTSIDKIVDNGFDDYVSNYKSAWVEGIRAYWRNEGSEYQTVYSIVENHLYDAHWVLDKDLTISWLDTTYYPMPNGQLSMDGNNTSIAFSLRYGNYDFVMLGDLPSGPEEALYSEYKNHPFIPEGDRVVYKAAHHGSPGANDPTFLSLIKPVYAWASAGITSASRTSSGPKAQHPYRSARQRIETYTGTKRFFWNGTAGTLKMEIPSDLSSFSIKGEGRKKADYYYQGNLVDPESEKDLPMEETKWAASGC